jgi:DNA-binding NtrC family response regulator
VARVGRRFSGIAADSMRRLEAYHWPGNIRELQNVIEQSAVLCDDKQLEVPDSVFSGATSLSRAPEATPGVFAGDVTLEEMKKRYISHMLSSTRGNMARTATILGVDRRSLYRMLARYQLGAPEGHRARPSGDSI